MESTQTYGTREGDDMWGTPYTVVAFTARIATYDQLKSLSNAERGAILTAFTECAPNEPDPPMGLAFVLDTDGLATEEPLSILSQIEIQRELMLSVATGGPRIQAVDDAYKKRRARIAQDLDDRGVQDPNPFDSLWDWYAKWSRDLPDYRSRRDYLSTLFGPLVAELRSATASSPKPLFSAPTGWAAVDQGQALARTLLNRAKSAQDYQSVGLHCRELLITLGQAVFDAQLHPSIDDTAVSSTDAKRMLEAYVAAELTGNSNEQLRKHARASIDLANALQHRRTATFRDAALCAEATTSIINLIAIVSGRRDHDG